MHFACIDISLKDKFAMERVVGVEQETGAYGANGTHNEATPPAEKYGTNNNNISLVASEDTEKYDFCTKAILIFIAALKVIELLS